ncbi:hypothetical protein [Pseudidiomarina sp.]|uniref:hypothetical protein n=1 Tax=Pseudidiomarina sp. TaxID=2081707 RepID=UPI00299D47FE|nr:hypothetical protein [Pseudidiomarina sp.]MDX1706879.1 hypothetical protein [Pseudidiomarina sp.]
MSGDKWHQCVSVKFSDGEVRSIKMIKEILHKCEFIPSGDGETYTIPRKEHIEDWQTESIVYVSLLRKGEEVYFNHEGYSDWDVLNLEYLLPWLPIENITTFLETVEYVSKHLGISAEFNGGSFVASEVKNYALECARELTERMEAPGGEFLAQAIEMDLPV